MLEHGLDDLGAGEDDRLGRRCGQLRDGPGGGAGHGRNFGITSEANSRRLASTSAWGISSQGVEHEVDPVDADALPAADLLDEAGRVADGDALGQRPALTRCAGVRLRRRRRQVAEALVGARRVRLTGPQQVAVGEAERRRHAPADGRGVVEVLVAVQEVLRRHLIVDAADGIAQLDAAAVLGRAPLLLGEAHGGHAEAADPAVGGVELGAGRRHGDPQRRVRVAAPASAAPAARASASRSRPRRTARPTTSAAGRGRTRPTSAWSGPGRRRSRRAPSTSTTAPCRPPAARRTGCRAPPPARPRARGGSSPARRRRRRGRRGSAIVRAATAVRNTSGAEQWL